MNQERIVELAADVDTDLGARINFLLEIDKLKGVLRRSRIVDGSRYENTAEHSWHLAMAAMVLAPHAGPEVDITRAVEILLVHDLVEIDAGDTYIYDTEARANKERLEQAAAERIFNLLPASQAAHVAELWNEYERRETPTAVFAYAVDRLQPVLLNAGSGGVSWQEHGIRHSQAEEINSPIGAASSELWQLASSLLGEGADRGALVDDRAQEAASTL
ncbi:MAG: HD domain-containing protein [Acidimicrobiales bacterium]